MPEAKWLDAYSGQTVDELLAMAPEYRIDSLVLAFEQAVLSRADWRNPSAALNEAELTIATVEALEREVNNGGYHQFFLNTPQFAPYVVAACRRIGCPKTAEVSAQAIALLGLKPGFATEQVEAVIENDADGKLVEVLIDKCDGLYYDSGEPIADRLFEYIGANRTSIRLA
jgi:hypothetical protein